jgi:hypothetical protein
MPEPEDHRVSEDQQEQRQARTPQIQPPAKSRFFVKVFLLVVLLAAGAGVLQFFGKLGPLLRFGRDLIPEEEETVIETIPEPSEVEEVAETEPEEPPEAALDEEESAAKAELKEDPKLARLLMLAEKYRPRFNPLKVGDKVVLSTKTGGKFPGTIEALGEDSVQVKNGETCITLNRSELSARSQAKCWEDVYVAYMVTFHLKREEDKKQQAETIARYKAEHARIKRSSGTSLKGASQRESSSSRSSSSSSSIQNMDMRKWMEDHMHENLELIARQKRLKEYEAQRIAEGREY